MASHLVSQHQQSSFATPINGAAGDATVVLGNDNATVSSYNSHDSDATIHVQSSTAAVFGATPAGTEGRKWMTQDANAVYLYYDNGSAWVEVNYLRNSGAVTLSGSLTITGGTVVTSTPVINATQTWNDGAVTFTGIKLNVTATASAAASLLMDLQVGGAQKFVVGKDGRILANIGAANPLADWSISSGVNVQGTTDAGISVAHLGAASTTEESYLAFFGKDAGGTIVKQMSISAKWRNTSATNGYNALRLNATYKSGGSQFDDLQLILFGNVGMTMFGANETDEPPSGIKCFSRGVIGFANNVFLKSLNASAVVKSVIGMNASNQVSIAADGENTIFGGSASVAAASSFAWITRSQMSAPADGVILLTDTAGTAFSMLKFGGTTSSFPALKRASARLLAKLADDSAYCAFEAASVLINSGTGLVVENSNTPASAAATGTAGTICWDASFIYVCTATNTWERVAIATW